MAGIADILRELETISLKPSQEEIAGYKRILSMIPQWESEIREAERAGMDMGDSKRKLQDTKEKLSKLVSVYG